MLGSKRGVVGDPVTPCAAIGGGGGMGVRNSGEFRGGVLESGKSVRASGGENLKRVAGDPGFGHGPTKSGKKRFVKRGKKEDHNATSTGKGTG